MTKFKKVCIGNIRFEKCNLFDFMSLPAWFPVINEFILPMHILLIIFADDIAVRFFEVDEDGQDRWEAYGVFGPADVHRQVRS